MFEAGCLAGSHLRSQLVFGCSRPPVELSARAETLPADWMPACSEKAELPAVKPGWPAYGELGAEVGPGWMGSVRPAVRLRSQQTWV